MTSATQGAGRHSPPATVPLTPQAGEAAGASSSSSSSSSSTSSLSAPGVAQPSAAWGAFMKRMHTQAPADSKSKSLLDFTVKIAPAALEAVRPRDHDSIHDLADAVLCAAATGTGAPALAEMFEPRLAALAGAGYEFERLSAAVAQGLVAAHVASQGGASAESADGLVVAFHALLLALRAGSASQLDAASLAPLLATCGQPQELLAAWVRLHEGAAINRAPLVDSLGTCLQVRRQGKSADWLAAAVAGIALGCAAFDTRPAAQRQAAFSRFGDLAAATADLLPSLSLAEAEGLARGLASGMAAAGLADPMALAGHMASLFKCCLGKKGVPTEHLAALAYGGARGVSDAQPPAQHLKLKLAVLRQLGEVLDAHPFESAERRTDLKRRVQAWLADDKLAAKALKPAPDLKSSAVG